jgi:tellurite resistance protein
MIKIRRATVSRLRDRLKETGSRPSMVVSSTDGVLARTGLLPPEEATAVQSIDPVVEMMFLMMAADGTLADDERLVIRGAVRELTENFVRSSTLAVMLEDYEKKLATEGQQARLQEVAQRLHDDVPGAESAFVLAAAVAFADEDIQAAENELLDAFADAVGISEERANQLLDELEADWKTDEAVAP